MGAPEGACNHFFSRIGLRQGRRGRLLDRAQKNPMSDDTFLVAVQKVTAGGVPLADVINTANELAGRGEGKLAQQLYKIWVNFNPEHPQLFVAHFNLAVVATSNGDIAAAMESLKAALQVNPEFLPAYINLGGLLERTGAPNEGIELWKTAITKLTPVTGPAVGWKIATLKQIGRLLGEHQKLETAEAALQECLTLNPGQRDVMEQLIALRLGQCKWPVVVPFEGCDRRSQVSAIHPLSMAAYTDDPLLQLASSWRYTGQLVDEDQDLARSDRRHSTVPANRRLRIGYVSSDLRDHAIGYLMAELFEVHDRSKVEVFAYYCGRPSAGEGLQQRIKAAVEHWVDIREMSDDEAAAKIAADGIDILVDVNGHTRDARTAVFARRPAPIQVNWLGFPSTMGSPYHHYIVADDWIIPRASEIYYSEKVLRLPCYQANDRKRIVAPEKPTRAQFGLPEDAVVFCCFNGVQKINTFTFARWMEVLKRTPNSVLWLLENAPEANERLRAEAERHGVDRGRIHFAPKLANPWHLARYPLADLFLDTAPYGAHTTCSDALWMGVPIVTLSGKSFASRVCGSLVRSAGLPELVVDSPDAFVDLAARLGNDPAAIAELKARLEAGRATCTLFDMDLLVSRLEDLYAHMADEHRAGRTPQPDLANLDAYLAIGVAQDHERVEMLTHPDYHGLYRAELKRRHRVRPLHADTRLWTAAEIARADAADPAEDEQPLRRAVGA
jgi:predicted O-linked N-acetylglucosamine transferase (SPINDLY family)